MNEASDPRDRPPLDQATIDQWRACYGLDKRTPADAARWWSEKGGGAAPYGCAAALGIALDEIDALRKDAARYRLVRRGQHWSVVDGIGNALRADELDAAIDAAIAAAEKGTK